MSKSSLPSVETRDPFGPTLGERSPDGRWEWDGTQWRPASGARAAKGSNRGLPLTVLIALVATVVVVVAALGGAGVFVGRLVGASQAPHAAQPPPNPNDPGYPASCGALQGCLRGVTLTGLEQPLQAQGFRCGSAGVPNQSECIQDRGVTEYRITFDVQGGQRVSGIEVDVDGTTDQDPKVEAQALFERFAALPFEGDAARQGQARSWVDATVTKVGVAGFGGYLYTMRSQSPIYQFDIAAQ